jgi:hypothetical protein
MKMSESTYRVERDRQTAILRAAIEKVVQDVGTQFETPMLNAVIGAQIASLAESVAAIADHRTRKQMQKLVQRELTSQVAELVAVGRPGSRTIVVDGGLH